MGLIYNGRVVPGIADVRSWKSHGMRFTGERWGGGVRPRIETASLVVGHFTASEASGESFFRNIRRRKTRDKLGLSAHFFIDYEGLIWQYADLNQVTRHAGIVNGRSVGIEMQNRGVPPTKRRPQPKIWAKKFPRGVYRAELRGRNRRFTYHTSKQLEAWCALTDDLVRALDIPRRIPATSADPACGVIYTDTLPREMWDGTSCDLDPAERFDGVVGHFHVHKSKIDPGIQPLDELVHEGFDLFLV